MPDSCAIPYSLIPLSSEEALWEWDIVCDRLYLSQGALEVLNLKTRPRNMADYYALMPPDAALELAAVRESAISGKAGSLAECGYLCNGLWIQENLMVLTRNSEGRATRIMGHIAAAPIQKQIGFRSNQRLMSTAGVWVYNVEQGLVWQDKICERILGGKIGSHKPLEKSDMLLAVHPTEREALRRHYALFCKGRFLGDTITDLVRVRLSSGEYIPVMIRASAMSRDDQGKAILIGGIIAPGETQASALSGLEREDRLFHALNTMGSGQWNWDTRQDTVYFCPRYVAMLGYAPEEESGFGKKWRQYIHPDDIAKVNEAQAQIIDSPENGDTYECTYRMRRADGGWAWIFDRGCVTWRDPDGRAAHMVGSITNITTAQAERDRLEELVRHDTLTGLRSLAFCNLEIEHIEQNGMRPTSVISIDITGLKMINDYLGHARGDELLIKAAAIMRGALRRSDCIGRTGGDEFLVLLPGCDQEKARKITSKLEHAFEKHNAGEPPLPVFAAIGFATAKTPDISLRDAMAEADENMYKNKKHQRKHANAVLKSLIRENTGHDVGSDERMGDV